MPVIDLVEAVAAMEQLDAEDELRQRNIADWPSIKEGDRNKIGARLMKIAKGTDRSKRSALSNAQLAEILKKR